MGPLRHGSTTLQRLTALRDLGHEVHEVDTWSSAQDLNWVAFFDRVVNKTYRWGSPIGPYCRDLAHANQSILNVLRQSSWDILWIDKGLTIDASTLAQVRHEWPAVRIVGYAPDDMVARHNHSRQFLKHLPFYDVFFTTKSYNVPELRALGCPRVHFVDNAYDPHTHRPLEISLAERNSLGGAVGFVGSYEFDRAKSMAFLAGNGYSPRIYGGNWARRRLVRKSGLICETRTVVGEEYARTLCAFDINLHFLRKINRDQQTTRSIEIPACGKFMLAERTEQHLGLFEEGKEAVFFGSDTELLDKTAYYLRNSEEREKIARAGRRRCLRNGYSNHDRLRHMLRIVQTL